MSAPSNPAPLSNAQHIRSRPGMYIGGLNERGLLDMLAMMIDEELAVPGNRFSHVKVALLPDDFYQVDFIGDIFDVQPRHFVDFIKHDETSWGIDLVVIAAMSDPLEIEVIREGQRWRQRLVAGVPLEPPTRDRLDLPNVLRLKYRPDPSLFKHIAFPAFAFVGRMQELAIFHPQTTFEIDDQHSHCCSRQFHYPLGLRDYIFELEHDCFSHGTRPTLMHLEISEGPNRAQALMLPTHYTTRVTRSYLNQRRLPGGGPHIQAFQTAFRKVAQKFERREGYPFSRSGEDGDPLYGLTIIFSFDLAEPDYFYSNKARLSGELPAKLITRMIDEQLPPLLKEKTAQSAR